LRLLQAQRLLYELIVGRAPYAGGPAAAILLTAEATLLTGAVSEPPGQSLPVVQVTRSGAAALLEGSGHHRTEPSSCTGVTSDVGTSVS